MNGLHAGQGSIRRNNGQEALERSVRYENTCDPTQHRKHHRFREKLLNQAELTRPSAARTAISGSRCVPRIKSRFARLAQATSRTNPTAIKRTSKGRRTVVVASSRK